jgi:hypothetical protein
VSKLARFAERHAWWLIAALFILGVLAASQGPVIR